MAQDDIIKILEENELEIKDIYNRLNNLSQVAIRVAIHQLIKYQEIEKMYIDGKPPVYKISRKKEARALKKSPSPIVKKAK